MSINIPTAYKTDIIVPYGSLNPILEWCRENCTDEWKFDDAKLPVYEFYFESERDYIAFVMWKK